MQTWAKIDLFCAFWPAMAENRVLIYPDLESGNEFWKREWAPGSSYKSLILIIPQTMSNLVKSNTNHILPIYTCIFHH